MYSASTVDAVRTLVWTVEAARNEDLEADYREAMTDLTGNLGRRR